MDRKGITAIVLSVVVLIVWQIWFAPKLTPPPQAAASPTPAASASPSAAAAAATPAIVPGEGAPTPAPMADNVPAKITDVPGAAATYHFTNRGGGILQADLYSYTTSSGSAVTINEFGTAPIGAISESASESNDLPYTVAVQGNTVICVRDEAGGLSIAKKFSLPATTADAQGYQLNVDVTFTNHGSAAIQYPGYYFYAGSATPLHQRDYPTYTAFDWNGGGKANHIDVNWFSAFKIPLLGIETHPEKPFYSIDASDIRWASVGNQFFTTIVAPAADLTGVSVWARRFPVTVPERNVEAIEGALKLPAFSLAPGASVTQSFKVYTGPKIYSLLKSMGDGQQQILHFGLYTPISVFLLSLMNLLHGWTHNYAVAIIIMTLCIRGILWPIQNKATASMRQMQAISPRMNELKEKYKDDPNRLNQEIMKMYKEYNINPMAGCWPMLIQMPIFFGFYRLLGTAIELRGSRFLWVHDLSQPDTIFHLAGYPINVLPICMAVTMLAQVSLQPKTGDQAQQRMTLFMPLIFILFCYNFASALALYYTVQNIFSIVQLYVTRKKFAAVPVKAPVKRKSR